MIKPLVAASFLLVVAACGSDGTTSTPPADTDSPASSASRAKVPWGDYAADVHSRIDRFTERGACSKLQDEFDNADSNNAATSSRTGHNNAALMAYIDEALKLADCY